MPTYRRWPVRADLSGPVRLGDGLKPRLCFRPGVDVRMPELRATMISRPDFRGRRPGHNPQTGIVPFRVPFGHRPLLPIRPARAVSGPRFAGTEPNGSDQYKMAHCGYNLAALFAKPGAKSQARRCPSSRGLSKQQGSGVRSAARCSQSDEERKCSVGPSESRCPLMPLVTGRALYPSGLAPLL